MSNHHHHHHHHHPYLNTTEELQPIYLRYSVMCEPLHVFTIDERIKSEGGAIVASLWPTGVAPWRFVTGETLGFQQEKSALTWFNHEKIGGLTWFNHV